MADLSVRGGSPFAAGRLRRLELWAVFAAASFATLGAAAALFVGGGEVLAALGRIDALTLLLLLALSLANYGFRVLRWHRLALRLAVAAPIAKTLLYYVAGFAMTATPGRVGEALRLWLIKRSQGHRYDRMLPLFLADRLFDSLSVLLLGLVGIAAFPQQRWIAILAVLVLMVVTASLARPGWLLQSLLWLFGAVGPRFARPLAGLRRSVRGTAAILKAAPLADALVLSIIGWGAECIAFSLLLDAMGAPIGLAAACFVFAFSAAVGAATLLPGGLGGTEATMVALLSSLGVDLGTGLAATLVIRATTLWFGVALGFLALPFALRIASGPATEAPA
ncbi:MAG TPA: lysylphosphatidylglycerol synthase transmembrane domain-containing protein [Alphaproteobacteria bacterium]|nr:lysylphosphatidylglycerol synthase transmembrane domain-containing protein [Alphaproteobacteria bacterium]